jgi:hypothetical protein
MSQALTHLHIATERFLELMAADPQRSVSVASNIAISEADLFLTLYRAHGQTEAGTRVGTEKMRGCRDCYGSGGKVSKPCKACQGTGKVRDN